MARLRPSSCSGREYKEGSLGKTRSFLKKLTVNDNLTMQTDFRAIYGTILEKWFEAGAGENGYGAIEGIPQSTLAEELINSADEPPPDRHPSRA